MYTVSTEDIKIELALYIQKKSKMEVKKIWQPKKKKKKKALLCPYAQISPSFSPNEVFCTKVKC